MIHRVVAVVVPFLALVLAACGGAGDTSDEATPTPEAFVSAASVLQRSGERFQQDVETFVGRMTLRMSGQGSDLEIDYELQFEAPDRASMVMDLPNGETMDVLMYGNDFYMRLDGEWFTMNSSQFGVDIGALRAEQPAGPISYTEFIDSMEDMTRGPDTTEGKRTMMNFSGTLDPASIRQGLPDGVLDESIIAQVEQGLESADFEVVVDAETLLPQRFSEYIVMDVDGQMINMEVEMEIDEYNVEVDIPEPPVNARELPLPTP